MPGGESQRQRVLIRGRVQGVGFRFFARDVANSLRLSGTVRNLSDMQTVEAVVQGPPQQLAQFVAAMREGPPAAHVTEVETQLLEPDSGLSTFSITA